MSRQVHHVALQPARLLQHPHLEVPLPHHQCQYLVLHPSLPLLVPPPLHRQVSVLQFHLVSLLVVAHPYPPRHPHLLPLPHHDHLLQVLVHRLAPVPVQAFHLQYQALQVNQ